MTIFSCVVSTLMSSNRLKREQLDEWKINGGIPVEWSNHQVLKNSVCVGYGSDFCGFRLKKMFSFL